MRTASWNGKLPSRSWWTEQSWKVAVFQTPDQRRSHREYFAPAPAPTLHLWKEPRWHCSDHSQLQPLWSGLVFPDKEAKGDRTPPHSSPRRGSQSTENKQKWICCVCNSHEAAKMRQMFGDYFFFTALFSEISKNFSSLSFLLHGDNCRFFSVQMFHPRSMGGHTVSCL